MLIEFLGLPGCGKSTLSRFVADLLMEQRIVVEETTYELTHRRGKLARQRAKLRYLAYIAARNPCAAFSNLLTIAVTRQASLSDMRMAGLNWLYILSLAARRSPTAVTILDQGIAQAIWTIGFAAQSGSWLDLLLTKAQKVAAMPDLVVRVRADFATIGDRLELREQHTSRMDALGPDHEAFRRGETNCDAIATRFGAIGVPVIEIENDDAAQLAQGAHRIADVIMTVLSEQKTAARSQHERGVPGETDAPERTIPVVNALVQRAVVPKEVETQVDANATRSGNGA